MSYKQCIFGIPTERATEAEVLGLIQSCMADLASQGMRIPRVYVLIDSEARARRTGLRLFVIGVRERGERMLARGPLFEFLHTTGEGLPVVLLLHDGQHGVFLFERFDPDANPRRVQLMSNGCYLGGTALPHLTIDYPQKGFTVAELRALHEKPQEKLTPAEARAIMEYHDAVRIGLRQYLPSFRGSYLDLLHRKNAWRVYDPKNPDEAPRKFKKPSRLRNFVAYWPEDYDWRTAGLQERLY
jgi:hypothetical protein